MPIPIHSGMSLGKIIQTGEIPSSFWGLHEHHADLGWAALSSTLISSVLVLWGNEPSETLSVRKPFTHEPGITINRTQSGCSGFQLYHRFLVRALGDDRKTGQAPTRISIFAGDYPDSGALWR